MGLALGASVALGAAGSFLEASQGRDAADLQAQAAQLEFEQAQATAFDNWRREQDELQRQAIRTNENAEEAKHDLTRRLDAERARIRVSFGETAGIGGLGTINEARIWTDNAYLQGLELSRAESNRQEALEDIENAKANSSISFSNVVNQASLRNQISQTDARLQKSNATANGIFGAISSGVQIATNFAGQNVSRQIATGSA